MTIYHFFQFVIGVKREADLGLCVDREQGIVQAFRMISARQGCRKGKRQTITT